VDSAKACLATSATASVVIAEVVLRKDSSLKIINVVQTFPTDRANDALPGRPWSAEDCFDAHHFKLLAELISLKSRSRKRYFGIVRAQSTESDTAQKQPAGNGVDAVLDAWDLCGGEGRAPNIRVVAEDDVEVAACRAHNHDRSHIIYSCYTKAA
jgi:hypothetical protein